MVGPCESRYQNFIGMTEAGMDQVPIWRSELPIFNGFLVYSQVEDKFVSANLITWLNKVAFEYFVTLTDDANEMEGLGLRTSVNSLKPYYKLFVSTAFMINIFCLFSTGYIGRTANRPQRIKEHRWTDKTV